MLNHISIIGTIVEKIDNLIGDKQEFDVYKVKVTRNKKYQINKVDDDFFLVAIPIFLYENFGNEFSTDSLIKIEGNLQSINSLFSKFLMLPTCIVVESFSIIEDTGEVIARSKRLDKKLYELLKTERYNIAKEEKIPPFMVFSNVTLEDLCIKIPHNENDFKEVFGFGETKTKKYSERLIKIIMDYENKHSKQDINEIDIRSFMTPNSKKIEITKKRDTYNANQGYSNEKPYHDNFASERDIRGKIKCTCGNIFLDTLDECPVCHKSTIDILSGK